MSLSPLAPSTLLHPPKRPFHPPPSCWRENSNSTEQVLVNIFSIFFVSVFISVNFTISNDNTLSQAVSHCINAVHNKTFLFAVCFFFRCLTRRSEKKRQEKLSLSLCVSLEENNTNEHLEREGTHKKSFPFPP